MLKIIIIIILIAIVYGLLFIKKQDRYKNDPIYKYAGIRDHLKTGDIILFSCKKYESVFNQFEYYFRTNFIGSEYGHAGIILRNQDKIYVVECTNNNHTGNEYAKYLNNEGRGGVRIVNFDKLIKHYHTNNNALFGVKFISKEISNAELLKTLKHYKKYTFRNKTLVYLMALMDVCVSHKLSKRLFTTHYSDNKMICTEFVHHILHKCNVLSEYPSNLFWPHHITDETLDSLAIIKYSEPIKFVL